MHKTRQQFQFVDPEAMLSNDNAPIAIRMMVAAEFLRCSLRWFARIHDPDGKLTPTSTESTVAFVTLCGWTVGSIEMIMDLHCSDHVFRSMLDREPKLQELWDEITAKRKSDRIKLMWTIRNKCFGHFDAKTAKKARAHLLDEDDRGPYYEHENDYANNSYLWASATLACHFSKTGIVDEETSELIRTQRDLATGIIHLLHVCLDEFLQRNEWAVQPIPE
ncbi:MAG: hypothetical protein IH987_05545 [Planctomycetes bacterium]|nr:hypothetical protein [Planctomycetota bacterium]